MGIVFFYVFCRETREKNKNMRQEHLKDNTKMEVGKYAGQWVPSYSTVILITCINSSAMTLH